MLQDHQRRLEIGSHRERLDTVRLLGEMQSRDALALLRLATDDIDPQIRDLAAKLIRESGWDTGAQSAGKSPDPSPDTHHDSLF